MKSKRPAGSPGRRLGRDAWVLAARDALIKGGLEAVKIARLTKMLKAERRSFYYHFEDRDALLRDLLKHWEINNTQTYEDTIREQANNGLMELTTINTMWIEEKTFNPAYDAAMRDWARVSKPVARVVKRVDRKRIDILNRIFRDLGYEDPEAFIRARVAYFHQVGYLALGLNETRKTRRKLGPIYLKILLGR